MTIQKLSSSSHPIISIVTPCYNRGEKLSLMLEDVIEGIPNNAIEIILSDDSSEESSSSSLLEFSRKFPDAVVYRKNESRLGFAKNLIQAIHLSNGEYVLILIDEDSLVVENLTILIEDIIKNHYHFMAFSYLLDHMKIDTLEVAAVPEIEVLGTLRHPAGLVIRKELVDEAIQNQFVLDAIDKTPQYPAIPIGLYCASKFRIHKYFLTIIKVKDTAVEPENTPNASFMPNNKSKFVSKGSNWTPDGIVPTYVIFSSRATQIEAYIEMIYSIMSSANIKSFPFIKLLKSALDELIYILLEEGVNVTFGEKTVSAFYKRSAINSIRWLLFNRTPWIKWSGRK